MDIAMAAHFQDAAVAKQLIVVSRKIQWSSKSLTAVQIAIRNEKVFLRVLFIGVENRC